MSAENDENISKIIEARKLSKQFACSNNAQITFYMKKSDEILRKQGFAQRMVENLINDLLDFAKLENNCFALD